MNNEMIENKMLMNKNYRRLLEEKNKLVKRLNFAEQRLLKYDFALSDEDVAMLQQRIAATTEKLAEVNDKLADMEDGDVEAPASTRWVGHASKALVEASRQAARR